MTQIYGALHTKELGLQISTTPFSLRYVCMWSVRRSGAEIRTMKGGFRTFIGGERLVEEGAICSYI